MNTTQLLPNLADTISNIHFENVSEERKKVLQPLIEYIQEKNDKDEDINLVFICTHNSRRSQFAQIWAKTAASCFGIEINSFSGGVEVTEFNSRAVDSIKGSGFRVVSQEGSNAIQHVYYSNENEPINAFSKLFDDPLNKVEPFAAVMTCSDADENCPFIPGTEKRIAINYNDPKEYDDTPEEGLKYDERSMQIASEMFYVFSRIKSKL